MLGDDLYLENIQEYVQDEEKIVTYKWLSRKLDVPVNTAKRKPAHDSDIDADTDGKISPSFLGTCRKSMLYTYAVSCKDTDPIHVTYFVSGIVGSNGDTHHEVCLVNESSLEETKQRFSQLFSIHVYSVQKFYLKDSGMLFAADYDMTKEHIGDYSKWSTIDYPVAAKVLVKRPPCDLVPTQVAVSKLPKLSHHVEHDKDEVSAPVATVEAMSTTKVASNDESKHTSIKKIALKGKPKVQRKHGKGTVASLFAKQAQRGNIDDRKEPVKVKDEPASNSRNDATKTTVIHITSPKKSPHKSPAKRARPPKTKASEPPGKKLTGLFKGLGDSDIEDSQSDEEPPQSKAVSKNKQQKEKKKDVSESDKTISGGVLQQKSDDHQHRKRKRVQELSSDEEDLGERTGHRVEVESNSAGRKVKRRKRYKKMVTKMFTNEDGEMVTERVTEMVSTDASEGEEEEEEVKPKPTESQVKTEKHSPAKQTKQSSLKSFFKR